MPVQDIPLQKEHFVPRGKISSRDITLVTSSFILQAALVLVMATMNNALVKYGERSKYGPDVPMAALGVTIKASQLATQVVVGIATGIQSIYDYGCGNYDRVKKTYKLALLVSTVFLTALWRCFSFSRESSSTCSVRNWSCTWNTQ